MKAKFPNKTQRLDYSSLSVRPPKIADAYGHGDGHWIPGELPQGGFRAVIPFNTDNCRTSKTAKPETGNRITRK